MADASHLPIALQLFSTRDPPVGGVNVWTTQFLNCVEQYHIVPFFALIGPSKASDSTRFLPRMLRLGRGFLSPLTQVWFGSARSADVVHLCVSGGLSFWRGIALVLLTRPVGKPFVIHLHSRLTTCSRAALLMAEHIAEFAGVAFVTPSREDAEEHSAFEAIDNFVPVSVPRRIWRQAQQTGSLRLAYVGAMLEDKGLFELAEAISKSRKKISLYCYGPDAKPKDLVRLRQLVQRLGIAHCFHYLGTVPHDELPAIIKDYDALVLPSRSESFSLAVAEAMQIGLPVIATPVGFLSEAPPDAWIRLDPGDTSGWPGVFDSLADEGDRLLRTAEAAMDFVLNRFDAQRSIKSWRLLYERLLNER